MVSSVFLLITSSLTIIKMFASNTLGAFFSVLKGIVSATHSEQTTKCGRINN